MSEKAARSRTGLLAFAILALVCAVGFTGLGIWQVERLAWKNGLIAAVESRVNADPLDLEAADWAEIDAAETEYQRVEVEGHYLETDVLTQAVTALGGGFWVMTPLALDDGRQVLVNRGFVSAEQREAGIPRPEGAVEVRGLLRQSEPGGGFLRSNDPAGDRWYSRDVDAIGAALGVGDPAPFFVDAEAGPEAYPVGGLTVISFSNNHLVYALTWFGLALLCLFGFGYLVRDRWRSRREDGLPERAGQ